MLTEENSLETHIAIRILCQSEYLFFGANKRSLRRFEIENDTDATVCRAVKLSLSKFVPSMQLFANQYLENVSM